MTAIETLLDRIISQTLPNSPEGIEDNDVRKAAILAHVKALEDDKTVLRGALKLLLPYTKSIADEIPAEVKLGVMLAVNPELGDTQPTDGEQG